jgi:hypothetical protein
VTERDSERAAEGRVARGERATAERAEAPSGAEVDAKAGHEPAPDDAAAREGAAVPAIERDESEDE